MLYDLFANGVLFVTMFFLVSFIVLFITEAL